MNHLISIVLPVFNGERYLAESIESILVQTWKNWELILVDDCSVDKTPEICSHYVQQDSRIHYYRNQQNLRLPRSLNQGFSFTKGDYLTWTSDDNVYLPDALETMLETLIKKKADFVCASCRIMDEDGKDFEYIIVDDTSPKRLVGFNSVGACFLFSRKAFEATGNYDQNLELTEDFDYWQRMAAKYPLITINRILYRYRFHGKALTSTMNTVAFHEALERTLLKNRNLFEPMDWEQKYYYYNGLSACRKALKKPNSDGGWRFYYSARYFFCKRLPRKIQRILKHIS